MIPPRRWCEKGFSHQRQFSHQRRTRFRRGDGSAPKGPRSVARGASPWCESGPPRPAPQGRQTTSVACLCRPVGAGGSSSRHRPQGLTPLATHPHPSGVPTDTTGGPRSVGAGSVFFGRAAFVELSSSLPSPRGNDSPAALVREGILAPAIPPHRRCEKGFSHQREREASGRPLDATARVPSWARNLQAGSAGGFAKQRATRLERATSGLEGQCSAIELRPQGRGPAAGTDDPTNPKSTPKRAGRQGADSAPPRRVVATADDGGLVELPSSPSSPGERIPPHTAGARRDSRTSKCKTVREGILAPATTTTGGNGSRRRG